MKSMVREKVMREPSCETLGQSEIVSAQGGGKMFLMANNVITRDIIGAQTNIKKEEDEISYEGITLTHESERKIYALPSSVLQVFFFLVICAIDKGCPYGGFKITLRDFMQVRKTKDRKTASRQLVDGINTLADTRVFPDVPRYLENLKKKRKLTAADLALKNIAPFNILELPIVKKLRSKKILIRFSRTFLEYLRSTVPMPIPGVLLTCNAYEYPLAFFLAYLIYSHKKMNLTTDEMSDSAQIRENVLSVRAILHVMNVPLYEDIDKEANKNLYKDYRRRVIDFVERYLNLFSEYFTWRYCHARGKSLEDGYKVLPQNYDTLFVHFSFLSYSTFQGKALIHVKQKGVEK